LLSPPPCCALCLQVLPLLRHVLADSELSAALAVPGADASTVAELLAPIQQHATSAGRCSCWSCLGSASHLPVSGLHAMRRAAWHIYPASSGMPHERCRLPALWQQDVVLARAMWQHLQLNHTGCNMMCRQ
jgi:hypothetical protein